MEDSVEDSTLGSDKATVTSGMSHRGIGLMRLCDSLKGLADVGVSKHSVHKPHSGPLFLSALFSALEKKETTTSLQLFFRNRSQHVDVRLGEV